jgi:hypothetical protein
MMDVAFFRFSPSFCLDTMCPSAVLRQQDHHKTKEKEE